jgi:hypothetical protein
MNYQYPWVRAISPIHAVCRRCGEAVLLSSGQSLEYYQAHLSIFAEKHSQCSGLSSLSNFSGYTESELQQLSDPRRHADQDFD